MDKSIYIAPNFHKSFGIPREDMPQLQSKDVKGFLAFHKIPNKIEEVNPHSLKPTQGQFNSEKIMAIDARARALPILVSSDNYVLDGHHRWLANAYNKSPQKIIRLPVTAQAGLELMRSYSKSFSKAIHEDSAPAVSVGSGAIDNSVVAVDKETQKKHKSFKMWRRKTHAGAPEGNTV